ncbi:50S ribosomal protein L11 [Coccomyxa sp. Obi]|nr:50S ribosomal protein L11 [Coccomyxa sp. Obi]
MSKAVKKAKTVAATIKLVIKAGQAKPGPPVGPALGQAGLQIMTFCKDFNAKTADIKDDAPIPVVINAYSDKTFDYVMRTPPASYFIKMAAGIDKASQRPGHQSAATISAKHVYEIAKVKQKDLQANIPLESLCRSIVGTCRSMGVKVIPKPEQTS